MSTKTLFLLLTGLFLAPLAGRAVDLTTAPWIEISRLRATPNMSYAIRDQGVREVLLQLQRESGLRLLIAPDQLFKSPFSLWMTGNAWDVMNLLQDTNSAIFTLENGTWIARAPSLPFTRVYTLTGGQRLPEVRDMLALFLEKEPAARVEYGSDELTITVVAGVDFQEKTVAYLRWVDSALAVSTPFMAATGMSTGVADRLAQQ